MKRISRRPWGDRWEGWRCLEKSCDTAGRKLEEIYIYMCVKGVGRSSSTKLSLGFASKFSNLGKVIAPTLRAMKSCLYDYGFT